MGKGSGKTGQVTLGVWFNEETGDIHLSIPGHGLSTVGGGPAKEQRSTAFNLARRSNRASRIQMIVEEWDRGSGN